MKLSKPLGVTDNLADKTVLAFRRIGRRHLDAIDFLGSPPTSREMLAAKKKRHFQHLAVYITRLSKRPESREWSDASLDMRKRTGSDV